MSLHLLLGLKILRYLKMVIVLICHSTFLLSIKFLREKRRLKMYLGIMLGF
ncbi:hypothetical protein TFV31.5 [Tiger frog virus]|uniref:Uncharacterized protein n=1 Tax=Rana tigrina ranavirus TaxID=160691 RepID=A0A8A4YHJ9_RTRV|nr:hypothetical protein TFV31.5 [Tiger frog virus]